MYSVFIMDKGWYIGSNKLPEIKLQGGGTFKRNNNNNSEWWKPLEYKININLIIKKTITYE